MKINKKSVITTIAISLTLIISMFATVLPSANAHDPAWDIPTITFASVAPSTVGVNQQALIYLWLHVVPPTASGPYGDRWEGLTVTITKPDGTAQTIGPYSSDPLGFATTTYTPTQVGEYEIKANFPGQTLAGENLDPRGFPSPYIGDYFEASTSETVPLVVQEEPIQTYPNQPLPQENWKRPIDGQYRDWWKISGNWLSDPERSWAPPNSYVLYNDLPEKGHILWTKPLTFGGIVGGEFGVNSFHGGNAYEGKWLPPVIIGGRLYYNEHPDDFFQPRGFYPPPYNRSAPKPGVYCVDLRTGEEIWYSDEFRLSFGQILQYDSPNQHGAFGYLWEVKGSTWNCYDAFTAEYIYTIKNVPGGSRYIASDGSVFHYSVDTTNSRLTMWNSSAMPALRGLDATTSQWMWRPYGKTIDGTTGYSLNVTIPTSIVGGANVVLDDRIIGSTGLGGFTTVYGTNEYTLWCISTEKGREGQLLWSRNYNGDGVNTLQFAAASLEEGVFTLWSPQSREHFAFDIETGQSLWGPTDPQPAWDYTVGTLEKIVPGKLLSAGYAGICHAYDITTGELEWTYTVDCPYYLESKWGSNYIIDEMLISDGKVYLFTCEHSPDDPKERGSPIVCLDLETGEELWKMPFYGSHWSENPAIADSILVYFNTYDNQIYAFGKGETAVTVEAPLLGVPYGCSAIIRGTVTDQSPGALGTAAISDDNMDEWMQYIYQQSAMPQATGVDVTIDVIDSNGNYRNIGIATSDMSGFYSLDWMPNIPGKYTVIATFAGSESYWSSYAETAFVVDGEIVEAPPEATPAPQTDTYIAGSTIAILAGIAIAVFLILRKK